MAFTSIPAGAVDADSPLDSVLFGYIKDNDDYLKARLVTGTGHTHNQAGTDEGGPITPADASVAQAKLKSTTGSVSTTSITLVDLTLPGGEYGFYPQIKSVSANTLGASISATASIGISYVTNIALSSPNAQTAYAQQRYIQASPPYKLGNKTWGHFVYLLRDIATGTIRSAYEAEDPCWAYNGAIYLPKDDPGRLAAVPHPFADYWQKDPAIDGLEIVLVDTTGLNTKKWASDARAAGKGPIENLMQIIMGKGKSQISAGNAGLALPAITGFTDKVSIVNP